MSVIYPRMAVIGCGLIGSSVIRAAREAGAVGHVFVADASEAHRARILELGYADEVTGDIAQAVKDADLVVLAVPVLAMGEAAAAAAAALKPHRTGSSSKADRRSTRRVDRDMGWKTPGKRARIKPEA